jgi:iron complex outermembrane receptor protein
LRIPLAGLVLLLGLCPVGPGLPVPGAAAAEGPSAGDELGDDEEPEDTSEFDDDLGLADEFALLADEAVVELAARHRQDIGMSPSAITVITREDIATSGALSVPDLLRLVPGMDVVIASPYFTAINSRTQWTYENNTYLVLIDGREANVDLLGQAPWETQPIDLEDIERIEVIRGPGSALYGANAFAGVVSITTRAVPDKTSAWTRVLGGEVGVFSAGARVGARLGDFGFSLNAGADWANSHSLPQELSKKVWKVRGLGEYRFTPQQRLLLEVAVTSGYGEVPSGAGPVLGSFGIQLVRLAYQSPDLRAQLMWSATPFEASIAVPLQFLETEVAKFTLSSVGLHNLDLDVQYTLPRFYEPLMIITGVNARLAFLSSPEFLDADTYLETGEPGIDYQEVRIGAFLQAEWSPANWVTVTAGGRYDYNTETGSFVSPRLASVFQPFDGQFLRVSGARAFRRPAFLERRLHVSLDFPEDSFLSPTTQDKIQELMTRVLGNSRLGNEELWSVEAGYLGRFLDGQLTASFDVYYSQLRNMIELATNFVVDPNPANLLGLDLDASSAMFEPSAPELDIFGWELAVRYSPHPSILLVASWAHKEILDLEIDQTAGDYPKNLLTLGGRFRTDWGLLGSLYLFSRSEFIDGGVDSPGGILDGYLRQDLPNVLLVMARLGYRASLPDWFEWEVGARLFLPVSPFEAPHFRYYERGGGITTDGQAYGGNLLRRVVSLYLEASF